MSKEGKKEKKVVFVLKQTYKDSDPETVGAYDSIPALCQGLARVLAIDHLAGVTRKSFKTDAAFKNCVVNIVNDVARLVPALLRCDGAGDECRDGRTVYGYSELPVGSVMGVEEDAPEKAEDNY